MQALAVSFARKIAAATLAASLTFTLVPFAYADGEGVSEGDAENVASGLPDQSSDSIGSVILSEGTAGPEVEESTENSLTLASSLVGIPSNFINSDVALDGEPVIGSFTVDGLTFAVIDGPYVELVGVSSDRQQVMNLQEGEGSGVAPMLASGPYGTGSEVTALTLPETVSCEGVSHIVSSIGAYAFYLSGISSVTLPASISNVDDRAFRSSDVASVLVADDNPFYSSFDGALYDAGQLSLLLIPEGKQGTVRIPKTAEVVSPSVFSHCPLVDDISVDAGSAAFASENGLLYTSDLTTLLRVPAGAEEITIREGCTTIAAGALEACANLTTINAPATVTSVSPDVFHAIPTVGLPAVSLTEDAQQLSAVVVLCLADEGLPEIDPSDIVVMLPSLARSSPWLSAGLGLEYVSSTDFDKAAVSRAGVGTIISMNGGTMVRHYENSSAGADVRVPDYDVYSDWSSWSCSTTRIRFYSVGSGWMSFSNFSRTNYRLVGWSTNKNATPGSSQVVTTFTYDQLKRSSWYAIWGPADVTLTYKPQGGVFSDGTTVDKSKKGTGSKLSDILYPADPAKAGYTFAGWWTAATGGTQVTASTALPKASTTYYAHWSLNPYAITYDLAGGTVSGNPTTYDVTTTTFTLKNPTRTGYAFAGWSGTGLSGSANKTVTIAKGSVGDRTYTAHWEPALSADVPLEVEARVDVLGMEEQVPGSGYIESRCGEPLKVARVDLTPLDGAKELFGAGNVADVFLEVLAEGSTSPNARFSLGSSATESDASKLQALTMASYGTKVPISYRFAMAPEVQTSLVEHAEPKPVCTVAYTVALANPTT